MTLALRAPHDGGDADGRRSDDEAAGLGDDAHALRQASPARDGSARRSCLMSSARVRVVDRKAAADVERVAGAEPLAPRGGQQLRAGLDRLDVLEPRRRPASRRGTKSPHVDAQCGGQPRQRRAPPPDRSRTCATDRTPRRGCGTRRAAAATRARRSARNLRTSSGLSATKVRTPYSSALRMSRSRLIGCVWMQRARLDAQRSRPAAPRRWWPDPASRPLRSIVRTTAACGSGLSA